MFQKQKLPFNIYLIGFMGCGKSSMARYLHRRYGMDIVEMDEQIAEDAGMSISQIFETKGEPAFRQMETDLLRSIGEGENTVISCGGGVVLREENVALMKKSGKIILLTATPATILERVSRNDNRPLLRGKKNLDDIKAMMETRRPAYEAAADLTIHTDKKSVKRICTEIWRRVKPRQQKP